MMSGESPVAERDAGRRATALLLAVLMVLSGGSLSGLLLAGVVRLGSPSLELVATARSVDSKLRPLERTAIFDRGDVRIYCCAEVRAFDDTLLGAKWYRGGAILREFRTRFSRLVGPSSRFIRGRGHVAFHLDRPRGGWKEGSYRVILVVNGKAVHRAACRVEQAQPGGKRYAHQGGAFSVMVPHGWFKAESRSAEGALAAFVSGGAGAFPPRFAVFKSTCDSASPDYLNSLLARAGVRPQERFKDYPVGGRNGARRTYEWEFKQGGKTYRLRSTQALLEAEGSVYGLNCHSLFDEFDRNLPTFDSIIDSLKVPAAGGRQTGALSSRRAATAAAPPALSNRRGCGSPQGRA